MLSYSIFSYFLSICYLVGVLSDVFCLLKVSLNVEEDAYKLNVLFHFPYRTVVDRNGVNRWGNELLARVLYAPSDFFWLFSSLSFLCLQTFLMGTNAKKKESWFKLNQSSMAIQIWIEVYHSEGVLGYAKPRFLKLHCPDWSCGNCFPRMCSHVVLLRWVAHTVCCHASYTGASGRYWLFWTEFRWAFLPTG